VLYYWVDKDFTRRRITLEAGAKNEIKIVANYKAPSRR